MHVEEHERFHLAVSMKSGLEGRNNGGNPPTPGQDTRLNEVRPRRPEQLLDTADTLTEWT